MTDEQKESRIKVEDLPQAEEELSADEAKNVKGGATDDLSLSFNFEKIVNKPGDGSVRPQGYNAKGDPVAR